MLATPSKDQELARVKAWIQGISQEPRFKVKAWILGLNWARKVLKNSPESPDVTETPNRTFSDASVSLGGPETA